MSRRLPDLSRSRIQALIRAGCVTGGGRPLQAALKVRAGMSVAVAVPPPVATTVAPEDISLAVVYEDADIVVINKPPGLVVHPAPGHPGGTLVNALLFHCRDLSGVGGDLRPGIVHRLDRDTSGLIVVAKNDAALQALSNQFRRRLVEKRYVAVVHGQPRPPRGAIHAPIGRSATDRKRMSTRARHSRDASTTYRAVAAVGACALVRLRIATGRTHQIRVHMAHAGFPVVGDAQYGRPALDRALPVAPGRQMLHAESLALTHPRSGERLRFRAPWPEDFRALVHGLRDAALPAKVALCPQP